ncbi:MAG: SDR family NAD(P)-dependent oxidoreductase [Gemmobacter sp.]
MRSFKGKRYWLVGASEGLGRALALKLARAGAEVIVSARDAGRLDAVVAEMGGGRAVACDVSDTASVTAAAAEVGEIDGLVFLAGAYWPMRAQDWDAAKAEAMCDVNLTGCARVMGAAMPGFVARGTGHVVITGSLSGFRGLPGAIGYAASKAGTMVLAESMYADLRGSGITVQVANPGFIRTRLTEKNDFAMPFLMEPDQAAQIMFDFMRTNRFKISFPYAFSLLFRVGQVLPDWAWYGLFGQRKA